MDWTAVVRKLFNQSFSSLNLINMTQFSDTASATTFITGPDFLSRT